MKTDSATETENQLGKFLGYVILSLLMGWWLSWLFVCYWQVIGFWKSAAIMFVLYMFTHTKVAWIYSLIMAIATIGVWLNLN